MENDQIFHTDHFYKKLWLELYEDFRSVSPIVSHQPAAQSLAASNIPEHRALLPPPCYLQDPPMFKRAYQLTSLFKRYIFEHDMFTDETLQEKCESDFLATQTRIGQRTPWSYRSRLVIQRARSIIKEILGAYSIEEHLAACRFGKRASVGNPAHLSYLDEKLGSFLTGSRAHIAWFDHYADDILKEAINSCIPMSSPRFKVCECLKLISVSKSFKSYRSIMPNTTLGSYYSDGLGKVLQSRLAGVGLNIRYLQQRHRRLAQVFSGNLRGVTADLSAASDSFQPELICALLPRAWWNALNFGRIRHVEIASKIYSLQSFMTMGIGFTFQLQTLCFYGLIKAIQSLLGKPGFVSVYGDDLIYPTKIHEQVRQIFKDLNFRLNDDKTFVKEDFRESCGGDFYCRVDVRPFQPEGSASSLSVQDYLLLLYKTVNGLLERWDPAEIAGTLGFLRHEICSTSSTGSVFQVPMDFPAYSGERTQVFQFRTHVPFLTKEDALACMPTFFVYEEPVRFISPLWARSFKCLKLRYKKRVVVWQFPYYWDSLRSAQDFTDPFNPFQDVEDSVSLIWVRQKSKPHRSPVTKTKFFHRLVAKVIRKKQKPICEISTSISSCW